ncbi:MAG: DUF2304 domain-containing protein [Anaerolineae bacterium]|nr:DUF2304 domain-containing protein [Anaerolineae bacterium]
MEMKPRFLALAISVLLVVFIVELVRRRKLREEYSWLWLSLSVAMFVLALWPGLLDFITGLIGAVLTTSTLFFFALVFLVLINIQFSVEISSLRSQVKNLAQQLALLREETPGDTTLVDAERDGED